MPHVLIIDDDAETLAALGKLTAAEGFTVAAAADLREARVQLSRQHPDVLLLDLNLPDGKGLELVAEIERRAETAIVLMTGSASVETAVEALRVGAADYLVKPVDVARLRAVLSRVARVSGAAPTVSIPVGTSLADADKALILATLQQCNGVKTQSAELLGISVKTLYNRLGEYRLKGGLDRGGTLRGAAQPASSDVSTERTLEH